MSNATETEYRGSSACPSYFARACRDAARGGVNSYEDAGYTLAGGIARLAPDDRTDDFWAARLAELAAALYRDDGNGHVAPPDDDAVWGWLKANLPGCMELVPTERRDTFLRGVYRYAIEEENDVTVD